jgi:hypothetical protein
MTVNDKSASTKTEWWYNSGLVLSEARGVTHYALSLHTFAAAIPHIQL